MNEGINVLSLFDGMSGGQYSAEVSSINVGKYYASEIYDKAISITNKHYPETIQLGDITNYSNWGIDFKNIDMVLFGFPCRNLSRTVINNKSHNQGLDGKSSGLFYYALEILNKCKELNQNVKFLCENVESMKKKDKDIITECLGVNPVMIDSSLLTAQDRKRYYWTNINDGNIPQPKDLGIVLNDICHSASEVDKLENIHKYSYWYDKDFIYNGDDAKVQATLEIKGHDILKRVNNLNNKSATLTSCRGGNLQKKVFQNNKCRKLTPIEYERLQGFPDNYTEGVSVTNRYNMLGDGWTVDVISHIFSFLPEEWKKEKN